MALTGGLIRPPPAGRRRWVPLAALALLVLAVHLAGLRWVAQHTGSASALRRMPEALFTRVLVPEAPPPPPETPALTAPPPAPARPAITIVQAPAAAVEAAPSAAPEPVAAAESAQAEAPPEPDKPAEPAQAQAPPEPDEPDEPAQAQAPPEPPVDVKPELASAPGTPLPVQASQPAEAVAVATAPAPAQPAPAVVEPTVIATPSPKSGAGQDPSAQDHWPRDSRVSYALSGHFRGPLYGSAQVQWQREGPRYQARVSLEISLAGTRTLTSQGEVTQTGLLPRVYEETRRGRSRHVRLDDHQLVFESGATAPRPNGVQDTASQFVELGWRFASGRERLEVGRSVDVWLARPGAVDLWTYDIVEREVLATPRLGAIEAYRLKPRPIARARGNITAEIWFAPSLQYLPARIRVALGEEAWVDLMVDSIDQR